MRFQLCHAAPADFTCGRQTLPMIVCDRAGVSEGIGDPSGVARRIFRPLARTGRRIDTDDAVGPDAQLAQCLADSAGLFDLNEKLLTVGLAAHSGTAAGGWPYRRDERADDEPTPAYAIGEPLEIVASRIDVDMWVEQKKIDAVEFRPVYGGRRREIEHRLEIDRRLGVWSLADQSRPHGVV